MSRKPRLGWSKVSESGGKPVRFDHRLSDEYVPPEEEGDVPDDEDQFAGSTTGLGDVISSSFDISADD